MSAEPSSKPIRLAIIGGGIGGLSLAIALLKHAHLDVQVYEAAPKFSEIGAGVAFSPNAQRAMKLIAPEMHDGFLRQATHNGWKEMSNTWVEFQFGRGARAGDAFARPKNETGHRTAHRAKFLEELVALVPPENCHFGKRLDRIEHDPATGGVRPHFADGTSVGVDAVIGADGLHSVVRGHLLGADHPALKAVFTGTVAYRGLIPMKEMSEAIGERYAQNTFIFAGEGGFVMIYPIDFGETANVIAVNSTYADWHGPPVVPADHKKIEQEFAAWNPTVRKIIGLLDRPETMAWSMWDHPPAPTYCSDRVAMMGDAAHATTPYQGQGAAQAIEDALVLGQLFGSVKTAESIPLAFRAYDTVRRPRSQKICTTSREVGEIISLRLPNVMDDPVALKENIHWRMEWIWHHDVGLQSELALIVYGKLLEDETSW